MRPHRQTLRVTGVRRHAILVLGMHRSGTSALTRVLSLMGATLPAHLMSATDDNPSGYWESSRLVPFNNRLLKSVGLRWDDDSSLPRGWSEGPTQAALRDEARSLINEEFGDTPLFVFKDPRMSRLLPFWESILRDLGVQPHSLLILREPLEVAHSLSARSAYEQFRAAAVPAVSRGLLLWLRYVLDSEIHSRHMPRFAVDFATLLSDWRHALNDFFRMCPFLPEPEKNGTVALAVDSFLSKGLHRQNSGKEGWSPQKNGQGVRALGLLREQILQGIPADTAVLCDAFASDYERLRARYEPMRASADRHSPSDPWAEEILTELDRLHSVPRSSRGHVARKPSVVFLSSNPESRSHVYRVQHPVDALQELGWKSSWEALNAPGAAALAANADAVVISRGQWCPTIQEIRTACSARGAPLISDFDDLIFEPEVMAPRWFAYLELLSEEKRQEWIQVAENCRKTLASSDASFLTTRPLTGAASKHCPQSFILPNCLGHKMVSAAEAFRSKQKPSTVDGILRIGFASGTPTHHRDFSIVADALAQLIQKHTDFHLVIVGCLDIENYPQFADHRHRIELRPLVPMSQLHEELARFDINIAPLEIGNLFCEAKSEIRHTAAAALGIPTVASATAPLQEAVIDGETGFLASDPPAWEAAIGELLGNPHTRLRLGESARQHTLARFGPETTSTLVSRLLRFLV